MEADRRMNRDETADLAALFETLDHICQWCVRQAVAIIGEKDLFILHEVIYRQQSLPDIAPSSGIHKGNAPVRWTFAKISTFFAEI